MGTEVVDEPGTDKAVEGMEPRSILGAEAAMHLGAWNKPEGFPEREKDPAWEARGENYRPGTEIPAELVTAGMATETAGEEGSDEDIQVGNTAET